MQPRHDRQRSICLTTLAEAGLSFSSKSLMIHGANVVRLVANAADEVVEAVYVTDEGRELSQKADVFVLAAHAVESARLLLLSDSARFPDGLANRSGVVGRHFMDHLHFSISGQLKEKNYPARIGFHTAESHQFCAPKERDSIGAFRVAPLVVSPP